MSVDVGMRPPWRPALITLLVAILLIVWAKSLLAKPQSFRLPVSAIQHIDCHKLRWDRNGDLLCTEAIIKLNYVPKELYERPDR